MQTLIDLHRDVIKTERQLSNNWTKVSVTSLCEQFPEINCGC
jgi:hypothetical protein